MGRVQFDGYNTAGTLNTGYIFVDYEETKNVASNTSDIKISKVVFYTAGYTGTYTIVGGVYLGGNLVLSINTNLYCGSTWTEYTIPDTAMSSSFTFNHTSDGKGTFAVKLAAVSGSGYNDFNVFASAGMTYNVVFNETKYQSLSAIDRTAPTVSLSASAASTSSISISASADADCDTWSYKVDSGSWTTVVNQTGTSFSYTITGLSSGSHTVQVRAKKTSNQVYGTSSTLTVDTSAPTVTLTVDNIGPDGFRISATSDVTANRWDYKIDSGSWTNFSTTSGTSATTTITGLTPNTSYTVVVRARRASNSLYGQSSSKTVKLLGASVLHSAGDVAIDVSSPTIKLTVTVYGTMYHKLLFYDGSTLISTVTLGQMTQCTTSDKTYTIPSSNRATMLNHIPSAKAFSNAKVVLRTYQDSSYSTLIGDSDSKYINVTTSEAVSKPTFSSFTYEDGESRTVAITGNNQILLQKFSDLKVTLQAGTAKNGASISGYSLSIGDKSLSTTSTDVDVGSVSSSGDLTLRVVCADSRGYSTSVEQTVKILPYSRPKLSNWMLRRRDEIDALVQFSFSGSVSSVIPDDTEKNRLTACRYRFKSTADGNYGDYVDLMGRLVISGLSFRFESLELMELDTDSSYDFELQVMDELGEYTVIVYSDVLNQGTPLLALRKRSTAYPFPRVGINNSAPVYPLDVSGEIAMNDFLVLGYVRDLTEDDYLTSIKAGGVYALVNADIASTSKGYPVAKAGILEVVATPSIIIQRYSPIDSTYIFSRCYSGSAWTGWKKATLS